MRPSRSGKEYRSCCNCCVSRRTATTFYLFGAGDLNLELRKPGITADRFFVSS